MTRRSTLAILLAAGTLAAVAAQPAQPKVVDGKKLADNLFVLKGGGGNTAVFVTAAAGVVLLAQRAMKPGHERVPPYREPSPYMSAAEIQAELSKLDPSLVASRTGGAIDFAKGKAVGVARRRMTGPQYAITHTRTVEYMIVIKGTGTLVTGGTLVPPTIDSDPYPNTNPNATIRSDLGVTGGLARRIGPGDVVVNLPGTPHWLSQIDGAIDYFEIQIPNIDPAPGIERAELRR